MDVQLGQTTRRVNIWLSVLNGHGSRVLCGKLLHLCEMRAVLSCYCLVGIAAIVVVVGSEDDASDAVGGDDYCRDVLFF